MIKLITLFAQSAGQKPGDNTGVTISGEVVKGAMDGADLIINSFKADWDDLASGTSPVYAAVVAVSMLIALALLAFWAPGWYRKFGDEGFSNEFVTELVFPLIVILMLTNNGFLLANSTIALNRVSTKLNNTILSITRNGVTLKDAIRTVNNDQSFVAAAQTALAQCETKPEKASDSDGNETKPREDCKQAALQKINSEAQQARKDKGLNAGGKKLNILDIGGELVNNLIQGFVFIILSGVSAAFQYVVQFSFLLIAYVAPIFLSLSLLPFESKPIYAWLSGWLALTLVLVSYSIIVGIAASGIVSQPSTNPLLLQLIQAIFSPILAVAIGTGGGMSVFTAFTSGIKFTTGFRK